MHRELSEELQALCLELRTGRSRQQALRNRMGFNNDGLEAIAATKRVNLLRGVPEDYDEWAALGNDAWAWDKVLPYFRRLEDDQDAVLVLRVEPLLEHGHALDDAAPGKCKLRADADIPSYEM